MVVTHHAYNLVKLPGSGGTIVIRGVVSDALYAAQAAYKAAAVASPADEDEEPLPRPPVKKKQLFSQEKAATKQVPLEASPLAPTCCWEYALEAIIKWFISIFMFMIIVYSPCYNCINRKHNTCVEYKQPGVPSKPLPD